MSALRMDLRSRGYDAIWLSHSIVSIKPGQLEADIGVGARMPINHARGFQKPYSMPYLYLQLAVEAYYCPRKGSL